MQKSRSEFSWRLLPYAGLKVLSLNRLCRLMFQEHPILSRVESTATVVHSSGAQHREPTNVGVALAGRSATIKKTRARQHRHAVRGCGNLLVAEATDVVGRRKSAEAI